ncbi:MAG: metallophosphoesterase family protein [Pseudomonadota bacterium]
MSKSISAMLSIIMMLFLFGCVTTGGDDPAPYAVQFLVAQADAIDKTYHHLVVLGDPHLPGKNFEAKEHVILKINSWDDVEMVIAVGDICEDRGTDEEYAAARMFFDKLNKPLCPIVGNHDFIYEDILNSKGNRVRATVSSSKAKLDRFRETFRLQTIYMKNPQVFLWVSGHTHTSPKEESFASSINVTEKRITNIHNADMNRETIWTNSLFMYPDKIIVRTYDHKTGAWLPDLERTIFPPSL